MVLAAGRGERFGDRVKQLEELDGRPLVAHAVAAAHAAGVDRVMVVVGHRGDAVAAAAANAGHVDVVHNPRYAEGQSTSFVAGIRAVMDDALARVAVVLLADQPGITGAAVRAVVAAVDAGAAAARARYEDGPSHPIAFGRSCWPRLMEATGDAGARELLGDLDMVLVPIAARVPRDVDTPDDLAELRDDRPK